MRADKLKGHLDLLLLEVVAARPVHGYAVIAALRDRSAGTIDLPEGTVYPALHRLEDNGWVASRWAVVDGRRRRLYELTEAGRHFLAAERQQWWSFVRAVDAVLAGSPPMEVAR